jgi:hypothetical protein
VSETKRARKLSIYPSDSLRAQIERVAEQERRSVNQTALLLIEQGLTRHGGGIPHLARESEALSKAAPPAESAPCSFASRHHLYHGGNPCPKCGFPLGRSE